MLKKASYFINKHYQAKLRIFLLINEQGGATCSPEKIWTESPLLVLGHFATNSRSDTESTIFFFKTYNGNTNRFWILNYNIDFLAFLSLLRANYINCNWILITLNFLFGLNAIISWVFLFSLNITQLPPFYFPMVAPSSGKKGNYIK